MIATGSALFLFFLINSVPCLQACFDRQWPVANQQGEACKNQERRWEHHPALHFHMFIGNGARCVAAPLPHKCTSPIAEAASRQVLLLLMQLPLLLLWLQKQQLLQ